LAHAVADEGNVTMEKSELNGLSCIWVYLNKSKTLYFRSKEGIWAITGYDIKKIIEKAISLI
jgi:hypothetical protein